ncbi:ATP-binding protein [Steroidobacter sp. S1-65]|uniref:ATP-binding protein n=1 Tax=Steroidobacter gossypii TaxID=2805490 RepID=A0ABS1X5W0_9GAMM|nr:ATP-binding protein [Steroidobacter gossypii]MBM0108603.1 ATP-binding protein [Steroidobacter gossypii]
MTTNYELGPLWVRTLGPSSGPNEEARTYLRTHFKGFRERVAGLVATLGAELPGLTVHDITHLDALWRVADQIAGGDYPINPAEAFVLGGAFLLHDAAHVLAAYPGGLAQIKESLYWRDLIAQRYDGLEPIPGSEGEKSALFQTLRHLHAEQAHRLPHIEWRAPGTDHPLFLLENFELRQHYGDLIGQIASSHHWSPHRVANTFCDRIVTSPASLPTEWQVDAMKVAFLLRTADAAHIDEQRAPWFLFALRSPDGISQNHWKFQAKLGQPVSTPEGELNLSGSPFSIDDREAWWLAFDSAKMIDAELRSARALMQDERRAVFAVSGVQGVQSPETFARHVPAAGWQPVGVAARIDDVPRVIEMLGGSKLYGEDPAMALRELLQNAIDAVRALRALGGLGECEGQVIVSVDPCDSESFWLKVTDTGIGMSRTVLTTVLLDFGQSLWKSDRLRDEWPGLASLKFDAAGQFGIGFFSVFMLGDCVTVSTRRQSRHESDTSDHLALSFHSGVRGRPTLREPLALERLSRPGTQISVRMRTDVCRKLMEQLHSRTKQFEQDLTINLAFSPSLQPEQRRALLAEREERRGKPWQMTEHNLDSDVAAAHWARLVAWLCPASDVTIEVRSGSRKQRAVTAQDWLALQDPNLLQRLFIHASTPLVPLIEPDGSCVGRLGLATHHGEATLVYGGVRCGKLERFTGIALAQRPLDLRRQEAVTLASPTAWKAWAKSTLQVSPRLDTDRLRLLHAVCPDLDLPVILVANREPIDFGQCEALARNRDKVVAVFGELHAMAWDPPEWLYRGFGGVIPEFQGDLWFFPSLENNLPKALGPSVPAPNYKEMLECRLLSAWGKYNLAEKVDTIIAHVSGKPIIREAYVYTRTS